MSYSYCTTEDLKRVKAGQHLYINSRRFDLKRKDGTECPFVAKKDDTVVVLEVYENSLLVCFYEDTVTNRDEERYGPFLVEPSQIHTF